jgi:hypothetical protein
LELLVVFVLVGLLVALSAPALLPPEPEAAPVAELLRDARRLAARRSETVFLRVAPDGAWSLEGSSSPEAGPLARGRLADLAGPGFRLEVSPLGTCGLDAPSSAVVDLPVDPLTCGPVRP